MKDTCLVSDDAVSGSLQYVLEVNPLGDEYATVPEEGGWVISAGITVVPLAHWPESWEFRDVRVSVRCVPWNNSRSRVFEESYTLTFTSEEPNVTWPSFLSSSEVRDAGLEMRDLLSPEGYLLIQAEVKPRSAVRGPFPPDSDSD